VYSINVQHLKDIERIAIERDLTFYDASYVFVAETQDLKLIAEDEDLLSKCESSITLDEFLKKLKYAITKNTVLSNENEKI
jgi:predicted nucleic acid-binding protein